MFPNEHTLTRITSHVVESVAFPLPSVCSKLVHDHLPLNSHTRQMSERWDFLTPSDWTLLLNPTLALLPLALRALGCF